MKTDAHLAPELAERLKQRIENEGVANVARELGISRVALLAAIAGTGVRPGTLRMISDFADRVVAS